MRQLIKLIIVYIIVLFVLAETAIILESDKRNISNLSAENVALQQKVSELQSTVDKLTEENTQLKTQQTKHIEAQKTNRGDERGEHRIMEITAYDLSVESCGKAPNHPLYGITASGKHVEEWNTIAAGPELAFGTKVYIPYFKDKPNGGIFTVHDRGSAIKNGCIDVYIVDSEECWRFGRQKLEVWVLE